MEYDRFISELAAARLSGREFARLLRLNENIVSSYKRKGSVPNHFGALAVLMRLLEERGVSYRAELEALNLRPNAPRGRSFGRPAD